MTGPPAAVSVFNGAEAVELATAVVEVRRTRLRPCLYRKLLAQALTCRRAIRGADGRWTFEYTPPSRVRR